MGNKAFINKSGIQEIIIDGDQTADFMQEVMQKSKELDEQMKSEGKPLISLVDISKMGELDKGAIYEALKNIIGRPYKKSALYGHYETVNPIVKHLLQDVERISEHRIKVFEDRDDALKWLAEE